MINDHEWLMKMVELRVGDPWILRLIRKWLGAGIFENGTGVRPEKGTPQGGPLSPVLANVYLHYVLDLWFERAFKRTCYGKAFLIRFADDFIVLFGNRQDAERFGEAVEKRLAKFSLELAHEKTRLLPYGRKAWREGMKEHFDFLGFRHHLGTDRKGRMAVIRIPTAKSVRKFLDRVKAWLKVSIHLTPRQQQLKLNTMLRGFYHYFGLYHCYRKLYGVLREVMRYWLRALRRRSQRSRRTWKFYRNRDWFNLVKPRLIHPNV
jgi:group II intron reverse transcriptase/maturase